MSEDRAAYRENRAGLNSEWHCKKNPQPTGNRCKLQKEEYQSDIRKIMWSKTGTGAQRGCKISLLRGVQNLTGQDPGQPSLTSVSPAFSRELDLMTSKSSTLHYSVIVTEAQRQQITGTLPVVLIMLTLSFKIGISGLFIPFPNCWGIPMWY